MHHIRCEFSYDRPCPSSFAPLAIRRSLHNRKIFRAARGRPTARIGSFECGQVRKRHPPRRPRHRTTARFFGSEIRLDLKDHFFKAQLVWKGTAMKKGNITALRRELEDKFFLERDMELLAGSSRRNARPRRTEAGSLADTSGDYRRAICSTS